MKSNKKASKTKSLPKISQSFKAFFNTVNTPSILVNAKTFEVELSNVAVESLLGYTSTELGELEIGSFFSGEDLDRVNALMDILSEASGEVNELDLKIRKKSGKSLGVNLFASSVEINRKKRIVMSIHDVTKLKGRQEEKEKSIREMAHVSKLADIGRLAAGVAHELNNPLMIIQGFAENIDLMCEEGDQVSSDELKWQVGPILKAADRMAKIISQLTRLSRNDKDMKLTHVDLIEVVENIIGLVSNQFSYNDIDLIKNWESGHLVKCDPNQIEQIILNIISNAIHALSSVEEERRITISLKAEGKTELLEIHNNGPAIPKEIQEKILTPFFTTKEIGEGTGLGLSVSYGIMKAHGGDLAFKSKEGKGTTFSLKFPKPQAVNEIVSTSKALGLVVDDDQGSRQVIATKLSRFGYRIIQAESAFAALDILKSNPEIEFVFTDIKMPKMDGSRLIQEIRQNYRKLLVYAVSGFMSEAIMEHHLSKHGVHGFLTKPLDHDKVSLIVSQIEDQLLANNKKAS
ncbi:MAG: response regulator [Bdellovibrionales bacterium]|nr:response regulator [Bdellovibrionales bacterium]